MKHYLESSVIWLALIVQAARHEVYEHDARPGDNDYCMDLIRVKSGSWCERLCWSGVVASHGQGRPPILRIRYLACEPSTPRSHASARDSLQSRGRTRYVCRQSPMSHLMWKVLFTRSDHQPSPSVIDLEERATLTRQPKELYALSI